MKRKSERGLPQLAAATALNTKTRKSHKTNHRTHKLKKAKNIGTL